MMTMQNESAIASDERMLTGQYSTVADVMPAQHFGRKSHVTLDLGGGEFIKFQWGAHYEIGTAAYWIDQTRKLPADTGFRIGNNLAEEVVFCILGGHGIPAELAASAFAMLRTEGLIRTNPVPDPDSFEFLLRRPICVSRVGQAIHYRFPKRKSITINKALTALSKADIPKDPLLLREWLCDVPGIGLKTASWVLRNHFGSDLVAIIDIHIWRAGVGAGFFSPSWKVHREYAKLERAFIAYAKFGGVRPSVLDSCIWDQMRRLGKWALNLGPYSRATGSARGDAIITP